MSKKPEPENQGRRASDAWVGGISGLDEQIQAAMLSAIVKSSHDAIISKNLDGIITSWNRGAEELFGYSAEEAIGQSVLMLIPADRHDEEPGIIARIRRGERVEHYETVRVRKDGTRVDISLTVSPIVDPSGHVVGASKIARDITEQKRTQSALAAKERQLQQMIDSLPAAIYTTDAEGRVTHFNPAAVAMSGRNPQLGTDQWCVTWKLYRPDGSPLPHDECPMAVALKTGRVIHGQEVIAERPDGSRVWIQPFPTRLCDEAGNVVGGINMLVDITARKRADEAIKALNAQLGIDLEAMTRMHEVSTQLVQVGDFSSLLYEILDTAIETTDADMGNVQLLKDGALTIAAHRGFDRSFLDYFDSIHEGEVACGTAMKNRERVIVEDVFRSPLFKDTDRDAMLEANARAVQATPLVSRSGQLLGMFSTHYHVPRRPTTRELKLLDLLARQAADFIERHQAEEALRESEKRLSTFLAELPVGAGAIDLDGRWVVSNERIRKFMPESLASLDSAHVERWRAFDAVGNPITPRDWPGARALRGETTGLQAEMAYRTEDGSTLWLRMTASPLRSEKGFMVGAIAILEDIDAIKRAEIALRESEDRHRTLISVITDVPWTTDANGSFVKLQEYWGAYTGQSWEQMRGMGWIDAFHPDDRDRLREAWLSACQSGGVYQASGRLWNEEAGRYRAFKARATALLNADGAICEWVGAYTDVDEEEGTHPAPEHVEGAGLLPAVKVPRDRKRPTGSRPSSLHE